MTSKNKAAAAKSKNKKPEQLEVPGTERKVAKDVEQAAEELRNTQDARKQLAEEEKGQKVKLAAAMKKHGLKIYKYKDGEGEPFKCKLDESLTVKVSKDKAKKKAVG